MREYRPMRAIDWFIRNAIKRLRRRWKYRKTWGTTIGRDCISLDASLCEWLSIRLLFLAQLHHSHPANISSEKWEEKLRERADALAAYKTHWDAETMQEEQAIIVGAQRALRWVSDNLPTLWD